MSEKSKILLSNNSDGPSSSNTSGIFSNTPKSGEKEDILDSSDWESSLSADTNWWIPHPKPITYTESEYVRELEDDLQCTQKAFISLSSQYTRMKFKLQQIVEAEPMDRERLIEQLKPFLIDSDDESESSKARKQDKNAGELDNAEFRQKQNDLIHQLRQQINRLTVVTQKQRKVPDQLSQQRAAIIRAKGKFLRKIQDRCCEPEPKAKHTTHKNRSSDKKDPKRGEQLKKTTVTKNKKRPAK